MTLIILTQNQQSLPLYLKSTLQNTLQGLKRLEFVCTNTKIGQSTHLRSLKGGFEIQFKRGVVQTIFAYFRTPKMAGFQGCVKYGINSGWTIKGAVCFLGEPPTKNKKILEIIYPHLGLGLVFQGSWQNEESKIEHCYLFQAENLTFCAGCGEQSKQVFFVCECKIVRYCSKQCVKKHYGHHTIFCDRVQTQ